jgi:hypothetical protein
MSENITSKLNQGYRDALLSYYLGQYVPNCGDSNLTNLVKTADDVYEYLLIDPLVTSEVQTSRAAQAMSSVQQYINGIALNMEPGYNAQSLDSTQLKRWSNGADQYAVWGGYVELDTYPENYIDPTLRKNKTSGFEELITELNQKTISDNSAQQAVMNYLNKFEQVANLSIVSGYTDNADQTQGTYYLLGKTTTSPVQYYWRSFDMRQNVDNVVASNAWSEWYPINASLNEDQVQGIPRLAYFNNRLYLFWFERTQGNGPNQSDTITAYSSQCDFNRNWSSPFAMMVIDNASHTDTYCDPLFTASYLCTACGYNVDDNSLQVSLYRGDDVKSYTDQGYNDFSLSIDYWFNFTKFKTKVEGSSSVSPSKFLFNYIENESIKNAQNKIQSNFLIGTRYIDSVTSNASSYHNDLSIIATIPSLTKSSFKFTKNESNSLALTCDIPKFLNTSSLGQFYRQTFPCKSSSHSGNVQMDFTYGSKTYITNIVFSNLKGVNTNFVRLYQAEESSSTYADFSTTITMSDGSANCANELLTFNKQAITEGHNCDFSFNNSSHNWVLDTNSVLPNKNTPVTSSWNFSVYESSAPGCWKASGAKHLANQSNSSFTKDSTPWTVTLNDFTTAELTAGIITRSIAFGYTNNNGGSTAHAEYCLKISHDTTIPATPLISSRNDNNLGTVVFLSFSGNFADGVTISPVRLNTLFAKELINKANVSVDELLNWDTQLTLEPAMTSSTSATPMDFHGANGLYFWELFFHMPWLVANRLYQEGNYADAQKWFNYIFDPSSRGRVSSNASYPQPDYWNVRPLVELSSSESLAALVQNPDDPDIIAKSAPVHYQKAIAMAYLSNLIAAGDADYRLLTNDGLSQAKLRYMQAKTLLGPRPDTTILQQWQPDTLGNIAGQRSIALLSLENSTNLALDNTAGVSSLSHSVAINPAFSLPLNNQLLNYWDVIDSRLYNLRHNLSITGQPISIPLYATPVNPALLVQMNASGGSLSSLSSTLSMTIPPYRFNAMLPRTRSAVGTLTQMGQTLLSYYERKDSAGLQEQQQQQALDLSAFTISLQKQAIDALKADQKALEASKDIAQQRYDYYYDLYTTGISDSEQKVMNMQNSASSLIAAAAPFLTTGAALNLMPNIFGLATGGAKYGAPTTAAGMVLELSGASTQTAAQRIQISEEYRRRSEEWKQQYQQADAEMTSIDKQLDALAIRQQAAQTSLQQVQAEQKNMQATLQYISTRFTRSALYSWLIGQLSSLYYQAYDAMLSLCLSTEACWQYEMGDITTRFIQTNGWNDSYHGLLVGETLELNLQQMESAWLSRNERRLELTKTVSLKTLLGEESFNSLKSTGTANFSLGEKLFDNDYPGHYLRQVKFVTVSLPTLLGPWQDVRATLTQTGSSTLLKADINGVNYLNDSTTGNAANILTNPRASQQIAVSTGMNDSGLFELSFGDERYLPFEGTGAVSSWQLNFPRPKSSEQKAILDNLSDVIVQVHYTALSSGSEFSSAVEKTL